MPKIKVILLICIVVILILGESCYQKFYYSLDEVSNKLNSVKLSQNVYIKEFEYTNEYKYYTNIYIKDNIQNIYYRRDSLSSNIDNINALCIYENQKLIDINYIDKIVTTSKVEENYNLYIPNKYSFFNSVEQHGLNENVGIYKYCGKEKVNGKKCIKISFTDNFENNILIDYYYIDIESNLIIKVQTYSGKNKNTLELIKTITLEYQFDVVTDKDITKFDKNDYQDYEFYEF